MTQQPGTVEAPTKEEQTRTGSAWMWALIEYYSYEKNGRTVNPPAAKVKFLWRRFKDTDPAVMDEAVRTYVDEGRFFPSIAELKPHVQAAAEKARGMIVSEIPGTYKKRGKDGRMRILPDLSDDQLYELELTNGTIQQTTEQQAAQMAEAHQALRTDPKLAAELARVKAAYKRCDTN